jgi:hypothetical protein
MLLKSDRLLVLLASVPLANGWADPSVDAFREEATVRELRSAEAAPGLLRDAVAEARKQWNFSGFVHLALLGEKAAGVGESLAELLDDPNPYVRVGACNALGFTGRVDLWPKLAAALKDEDWRVSFCSCLGLARLKAVGALPALEELGRNHWYPKVRDVAAYTVIVLKDESPSKAQEERFGSFGNDYDWRIVMDFGLFRFDHQRDVYPVSSEFERAMIKRDRRLPWDSYYNSENSEALSLEGDSTLPWDTRATAEKKSGSSDTSPSAKKEIPTFRNRYPADYAAVSAVTGNKQSWERILFCELSGRQERDGETLLAFHGGRDSYGGFFVVTAGRARLILNRDVENLIEWEGRIVALTSIDADDGVVVEILREKEGWSVRPLHALPGEPIQSGIWPDGRLYVNTSGGAVIIGKDGAFEFIGSGRPTPKESNFSDDLAPAR